MPKQILAVICLFFTLLTSCKSQNKVANDGKNGSIMELILKDNYSGVAAEEVLLIKDQKSLRQFFATINRTRKPGLPIPEIDFQKDMLLVWCEGETIAPSLGLNLEKETSETYFFGKLHPKKKVKNTAIISPFLVYKLPLSDKKVLVK